MEAMPWSTLPEHMLTRAGGLRAREKRGTR